MTSKTKSSIERMRKHIEEFPRLLASHPIEDEILKKCRLASKKGIDGICLLGMGGSSIANQYVIALLRERARIPLLLVQDYTLPGCVTKNYAVIAVSYSGNTEETLAAFSEATCKGCDVFSVTSGGKLAELHSVKSKIPVNIPPRAALPLLLGKVLPMTETLCGLPASNLIPLEAKLESYRKDWKSSSVTIKEFADYIPLFIGAETMAPVAYRAKCQINENAKREAFFSQLPEANHNELEGFSKDAKCRLRPVMLRSNHERMEIGKRMNATKDILDDLGYDCIVLRAPKGATQLGEMMALTHYLDMISLILAERNDIDPMTVPKIERLKGRLE
jgi:glucose/mannose-6-phosphate isomerase